VLNVQPNGGHYEEDLEEDDWREEDHEEGCQKDEEGRDAGCQEVVEESLEEARRQEVEEVIQDLGCTAPGFIPGGYFFGAISF
jgi:hypothetical protein